MRNRFHEPRSDTPSPRRPDNVNANKSLYCNERETPSIRCPASAGQAGTQTAPGATDGAMHDYGQSPSMTTDSLPAASMTADDSPAASMATDGPGRGGDQRHVVNPWFTTLEGGEPPGFIVFAGGDPGPAGHVGLAGHPPRTNPSASDIHPRNRTPVGNV